MTKVYAVSSGSYSDYSINCLFTTRELAQQYRDVLIQKAWERSTAEPSEDIKQVWHKWGTYESNISYSRKNLEEGFEKFVKGMYDKPFIEEFDIWDTLPVVTS